MTTPSESTDRPLPQWYDDAKLGIFLHWGLYSVPGWAPHADDLQTAFRERGPAFFLRNNPYAEWYLNSMSIAGSPTDRHHRATYGSTFAYEDFRDTFDEASSGADVAGLAALCREFGARYVVLTTKHHDGFCLWPSRVANPAKGAYHANRDLVGDLTAAVTDAGMRMGLYYSGGLDWTFTGPTICDLGSMLTNAPQSTEYARYADDQVRELIDAYGPAVLWNDISWPAAADLPGLFAHYYDRVPDGVVNDRWLQAAVPGSGPARRALEVGARAVERAWPLLPDSIRTVRTRPVPHSDFRTAEYEVPDRAPTQKWEATRGIGRSFGANRDEWPEDLLSGPELIRWFVDVVALGGNALVGIGPAPDGSIPAVQQEPLRELGRWLAVNARAVFGTQPASRPRTVTTHGAPVRCTVGQGAHYLHLLEAPASPHVVIEEVEAPAGASIRLLGAAGAAGDAGPGGAVGTLAWEQTRRGLAVTLPDRLPVSPVHVLEVAG